MLTIRNKKCLIFHQIEVIVTHKSLGKLKTAVEASFSFAHLKTTLCSNK